MKKWFFMLLLGLFVTGCDTVQEQSVPSQQKQTVEPQQTKESQVKKKISYTVKDKEYESKKENGKWDIHYPILEGKETETCNQLILGYVKEKMLEGVDMEHKSEISLEYEVKSQTDEVLSILFTGFINVKGTAHPMNVSFCVNYNWQNQKEMELSDVVKDTDSLYTKFMKAIEEQCEEDISEAYMLLPEKDRRKQLEEDKCQFYLENGKMNVRMEIPAGAGYYQYICCDMDSD